MQSTVLSFQFYLIFLQLSTSLQFQQESSLSNALVPKARYPYNYIEEPTRGGYEPYLSSGIGSPFIQTEINNIVDIHNGMSNNAYLRDLVSNIMSDVPDPYHTELPDALNYPTPNTKPHVDKSMSGAERSIANLGLTNLNGLQGIDMHQIATGVVEISSHPSSIHQQRVNKMNEAASSQFLDVLGRGGVLSERNQHRSRSQISKFNPKPSAALQMGDQVFRIQNSSASNVASTQRSTPVISSSSPNSRTPQQAEVPITNSKRQIAPSSPPSQQSNTQNAIPSRRLTSGQQSTTPRQQSTKNGPIVTRHQVTAPNTNVQPKTNPSTSMSQIQRSSSQNVPKILLRHPKNPSATVSNLNKTEAANRVTIQSTGRRSMNEVHVGSARPNRMHQQPNHITTATNGLRQPRGKVSTNAPRKPQRTIPNQVVNNPSVHQQPNHIAEVPIREPRMNLIQTKATNGQKPTIGKVSNNAPRKPQRTIQNQVVNNPNVRQQPNHITEVPIRASRMNPIQTETPPSNRPARRNVSFNIPGEPQRTSLNPVNNPRQPQTTRQVQISRTTSTQTSGPPSTSRQQRLQPPKSPQNIQTRQSKTEALAKSGWNTPSRNVQREHIRPMKPLQVHSSRAVGNRKLHTVLRKETPQPILTPTAIPGISSIKNLSKILFGKINKSASVSHRANSVRQGQIVKNEVMPPLPSRAVINPALPSVSSAVIQKSNQPGRSASTVPGLTSKPISGGTGVNTATRNMVANATTSVTAPKITNGLPSIGQIAANIKTSQFQGGQPSNGQNTVIIPSVVSNNLTTTPTPPTSISPTGQPAQGQSSGTQNTLLQTINGSQTASTGTASSTAQQSSVSGQNTMIVPSVSNNLTATQTPPTSITPTGQPAQSQSPAAQNTLSQTINGSQNVSTGTASNTAQPSSVSGQNTVPSVVSNNLTATPAPPAPISPRTQNTLPQTLSGFQNVSTGSTLQGTQTLSIPGSNKTTPLTNSVPTAQPAQSRSAGTQNTLSQTISGSQSVSTGTASNTASVASTVSGQQVPQTVFPPSTTTQAGSTLQGSQMLSIPVSNKTTPLTNSVPLAGVLTNGHQIRGFTQNSTSQTAQPINFTSNAAQAVSLNQNIATTSSSTQNVSGIGNSQIGSSVPSSIIAQANVNVPTSTVRTGVAAPGAATSGIAVSAGKQSVHPQSILDSIKAMVLKLQSGTQPIVSAKQQSPGTGNIGKLQAPLNGGSNHGQTGVNQVGTGPTQPAFHGTPTSSGRVASQTPQRIPTSSSTSSSSLHPGQNPRNQQKSKVGATQRTGRHMSSQPFMSSSVSTPNQHHTPTSQTEIRTTSSRQASRPLSNLVLNLSNDPLKPSINVVNYPSFGQPPTSPQIALNNHSGMVRSHSKQVVSQNKISNPSPTFLSPNGQLLPNTPAPQRISFVKTNPRLNTGSHSVPPVSRGEFTNPISELPGRMRSDAFFTVEKGVVENKNLRSFLLQNIIDGPSRSMADGVRLHGNQDQFYNPWQSNGMIDSSIGSRHFRPPHQRSRSHGPRRQEIRHQNEAQRHRPNEVSRNHPESMNVVNYFNPLSPSIRNVRVTQAFF